MFDKTYTIKGTHAQYWKELCSTTTDKVGSNDSGTFKIFNRYIDAYMVAPLLGCLYGRKASKNLTPSDDIASMNANILIKYQSELIMIYRTILLADSSTSLNNSEKIDRAFRGDSDEEILKENMQIFHDYFLGGLEILHEAFSEKCTTDDDYLNRIYTYVNEFRKSMEIEEINIEKI